MTNVTFIMFTYITESHQTRSGTNFTIIKTSNYMPF